MSLKTWVTGVFFFAALMLGPATRADSEKIVDIAFSNGMRTNLQEAVDHLIRLVADVRDGGRRPNAGRNVILLYHVGATAKNLQEVALQKVLETKDPREVAAITRAHFELLSENPVFSSPYVRELATAAADPVEDLRIRTISLLDPPQTVLMETLNDAKKLHDALQTDTDLLLVSHSQGNLYSNMAISALQKSVNDAQRARLHVVGVAVPAAYIVLPDGSKAHSNYMTSWFDGIIGGLFIFIKLNNPGMDVKHFDPPLKPNMLAAFNSFGHDFESVYLSSASGSNDAFLSLVDCVLKTSNGICNLNNPVASSPTPPEPPAGEYFRKHPECPPNDAPPPPAFIAQEAYPGDLIEKILVNYPEELRPEVRRFAEHLWSFWVAAAKAGNFDQIASEEYEIAASEIQLLADMQIRFPKFSHDELLRDIQAALCQNAQVFSSYVRADRLVSGHPLEIRIEKYVRDFMKL
jgi:hypothetical protein